MKPTRLSFAVTLAVALGLAGASHTAQATDLLESYDAARTNAPSIQAAEYQKLASQQGVPIARSGLLPQVNGSASYSVNDGNSESTFGQGLRPDGSIGYGRTTGTNFGKSTSYGVNVQQSLYDHGRWSSYKSAKLSAEQADFGYQASLDQLAVQVAEAYFNALTAVEVLISTQAERGAVGRQFDQAQQRFDVGLTAITDVHESRARFDAARAAEINARNALDDAREVLWSLTHATPVNLQGLSENYSPSLPEPSDMSAWVDLALKQNPTLLERQFSHRVASENVSTQRSGHLPTLSMNAGYSTGQSWHNKRSNNGIAFPAAAGASEGSNFGVTLNVPIFSGFGVSSRVKQAVYQREAAGAQVEAERRNVERTTRNAYRALMTGLSEIQARQQSLTSARSAVEATEAGFEVGTRTIVDVLLSQQTLYNAERDLARSRHNFLVNLMKLKQASGVLDRNDVEDVNRLLVNNVEEGIKPAE